MSRYKDTPPKRRRRGRLIHFVLPDAIHERWAPPGHDYPTSDVHQVVAALERRLGDGRDIDRVVLDFACVMGPCIVSEGRGAGSLLSRVRRLLRRRCRPIPLLELQAVPPRFLSSMRMLPSWLRDGITVSNAGDCGQGTWGAEAPYIQFPAPPKKVLLIYPDDDGVQEVCSTVLSQHGFDVSIAASAEHGLRHIAEHDPDLVMILTMYLPGIGTIPLMRKLRRSASCPDVPVVVASGHSDKETRTKALQAGADEYLTKPFKLPRLLRLVRKLTGAEVPAEAT